MAERSLLMEIGLKREWVVVVASGREKGGKWEGNVGNVGDVCKNGGVGVDLLECKWATFSHIYET